MSRPGAAHNAFGNNGGGGSIIDRGARVRPDFTRTIIIIMDREPIVGHERRAFGAIDKRIPIRRMGELFYWTVVVGHGLDETGMETDKTLRLCSYGR